MTDQPFGLPAIIFAVLALPLVLGLVPPNRYYGLRTAATLGSSTVWIRANRAAGWGVLAASTLYAVVARLYPYVRGGPGDVWTLHLLSFVLPLLVALVAAGRYARRLP